MFAFVSRAIIVIFISLPPVSMRTLCLSSPPLATPSLLRHRLHLKISAAPPPPPPSPLPRLTRQRRPLPRNPNSFSTSTRRPCRRRRPRPPVAFISLVLSVIILRQRHPWVPPRPPRWSINPWRCCATAPFSALGHPSLDPSLKGG